MDEQPRHSACGDESFEQSLLRGEALARWKGLPIAWVEARPHEVRTDLVTESSGLVMIDCGATQADFTYGASFLRNEFTPGSIGYFAQGTELKRTHWRWSKTRRIHLDLDPARWGNAAMSEFAHALPRQTEIEFRDTDVTAVLRAMVEEAAAGSPHGQLFAESLSLGIVMRLKTRASRGAKTIERGKLSAEQIGRLDDFVLSHIGTDISLTALAEAAGFSPPQFVRLFKNTTGFTPHRYVLKMRLEKARSLVLGSDMPLAVVATASGFASQSHMTASFARAFCIAPGQMRRSARGSRRG